MNRGVATALALCALVAGVWAVLHVGWYRARADHRLRRLPDATATRSRARAVPYRDFTARVPARRAAGVRRAVAGYEALRLPTACSSVLMLRSAYVGALVLGVAGDRPAAAAAVARRRSRRSRSARSCSSRFDFWPAALARARARGASAATVRRSARPARHGVRARSSGRPRSLPLFVVWLVAQRGLARGRSAGLRRRGRVAPRGSCRSSSCSRAASGTASTRSSRGRCSSRASASAVLIAVHHVAGTTLHVTGGFGSQNVTGPGAHAAAARDDDRRACSRSSRSGCCFARGRCDARARSLASQRRRRLPPCSRSARCSRRSS